MPKSYRCPRPILELGERCLRRMSAGYFDRGVAPADHEGSVSELTSSDDAVDAAKPNEDWLFIARTNYLANRLFAALQAAHKPCRWVKSPEGSTARADGLKALYALERNEDISGTSWSRAIALLPSVDKRGRKILTRGVKTRWAGEHASRWDAIFQSDLPQVGAEPALVEAIQTGQWCELVDNAAKWREQVNRHGVDVASLPRIRVGTIHSVKGAEADNVVLLTTISGRVETGMQCERQRDEEHRIAYVAVTRTKRNLYVVNEGKAGRYVPRMEVL